MAKERKLHGSHRSSEKENRSVTRNHSVSSSSIPRLTQITRTGVQIDHDK